MHNLRYALFCSAIAIGASSCGASIPPTTSLHVVAAQDAPPVARVTIDDQPVGALVTVIKRGVALPPGKHRITIEAEGFFPWDQEVSAGDSGGVINLDVKLVRVPD